MDKRICNLIYEKSVLQKRSKLVGAIEQNESYSKFQLVGCFNSRWISHFISEFKIFSGHFDVRYIPMFVHFFVHTLIFSLLFVRKLKTFKLIHEEQIKARIIYPCL